MESGNQQDGGRIQATPPEFFKHEGWNKRYCPYQVRPRQSPYPSVKMGARRVDVGGNPPGHWCFKVEVKGSQEPQVKIARMYYERDRTTGAIMRTAGGKGKIREQLSENCTLTIEECTRLIRLLADIVEEEGISVKKLLANPNPNEV